MISTIPYARTLGILEQQDDDGLYFCLPFQNKNLGNVMLPALHGGALGGFMECSAQAYLVSVMPSFCREHPPKVINFSIDYLRSGRPRDTLARCTITKQGRRVVHVSVHAWQDQFEKPIAVGRAHFLLRYEDALVIPDGS